MCAHTRGGGGGESARITPYIIYHIISYHVLYIISYHVILCASEMHSAPRAQQSVQQPHAAAAV